MEMDSFDIILLSKQISAVKRSFYHVRTCPVRKRKALMGVLLAKSTVVVRTYSRIAGWPDQTDLTVDIPTVLKEVSPSIY